MTFATCYSKDNVVYCKHKVTIASLGLTAVFDLSGIRTQTTNWFVYIFGIGDILGHYQVRSPRMRRRNVELAYWRKHLGDILYTSPFIADFVSNFVAMATRTVVVEFV